MPKRTIGGLLAAILLIAAGDALAQRGGPPKRVISKIAGDVYRFQNNFHFSVFMVTSDGIVLTDPMNAPAAKWLKAELKKRFAKPVKYVIYSHDHGDHISGGEVFADTAIFIAHRRAKADIIAEKRPTQVPDLTFEDKMTVTLGGKSVRLSYVGRNHSDNSIVMNFPAERILHAVDFIPVRALAFRDMPDSYAEDWIQSLKRVEAMDFDILSPGHGRMGKKSDVAAFRAYMEDLRAAVLKAARAGKSSQDAQNSIKLAKYKDWGQYGRYLKLNIKGMYEQVRLTRRGNR
jgi:glyoxylase-like metal-dependent hydrolase (beta-lactamase superfamily II)